MNYTIDTTDLAGLGITAAKATYASLAAGALTLELVLPDLDATPVPWVYGDRLTLTREGRTIFDGTVTSTQALIGCPDYTYRVTVQDDWWILEHTTYARFVNAVDGAGGGSHAAPGGFAGADPKRKTAPLRAAIEDITAWATHMRARVVITVDATTIPFASTGSDSCAALIQAALRWQPGAGTRIYYYRHNQPVIRIHGPGDEGSAEVNLADLDADSVEFRARPDMSPPVCALVGKYGDYTLPGGGDIRMPGAFVYAVPPDDYTSGGGEDPEKLAKQLAPYLSPKIIHLGIRAPIADRNGSLDDRYIKPRHDGTPLGPPPQGVSREDLGDSYRRFWARSFAELSSIKGIEYGATAIQAIEEEPEEFYITDSKTGDTSLKLPVNYNKSLTSSYALWHGSFSGNNKQVQFNYSIVHQYARLSMDDIDKLPAADRDKAMSFFSADDIDADGKRWRKRLLSCRFCNISHARGWERADQTESGEGDIPEDEEDDGDDNEDDTVDYHAVLDDFFAATRTMPWEGSCRAPMGIPGIEACDLVGRQLHIVGGRAEWADMDATIQTAEVDLMSGAVTISCGAQGHLSFDDYARLRDLARLRDESGASPKPADPPQEPGSGGDPDTDPETPVTISAMFSPVNTAFSSGGLQIGAFAAYKRSDGVWWTSGGLVCQGGKLALIPPTKVGGTGNEAIMAVPRRLKGGGYQYVLKRAPIGGGSSSSSSSSSSLSKS